jgi:ribosomal protein S13
MESWNVLVSIITGINILIHKYIVIEFTSIYGIDRLSSLAIWEDDKFYLDSKNKNLSQMEIEILSI